MKPFEYKLIAAVGSLSLLVTIISITENPIHTETQGYDPKYAHLVSRNVDVVISKSAKFDASRTCFEVSDGTYEQRFSEQFVYSLKNAERTEDSAYDPSYGVGFQLQGARFEISPQEAINYLNLYSFREKIVEPADIHGKLSTDLAYSIIQYNCFFEYGGEQYLFQLDFAPMIPPYENYNQINITKNELGKPILSNADIVDYLDFNDTTVFNNQLDEDVRLVFTMLKPKKDDGYSPDTYTIPPHMSLTYYFRNHYAGGNVPYVYVIQPFDLHGSVLIKRPDHCMSMSEAKSVYSHSGIELKFPSYLPSGYKYGCTAMVTTNEVLIGYDNSGILDENLEFLTHYKKRAEYFQKGGIVINHYLMGDAKRDCINNQEPAEPINGNITIFVDSSKFENADGNLLRLCTDDEVYNIMGQLPKEDMVRMMKSIYGE